MKFTRDPKRNTIIKRFTQKEKSDLIELIIGNQIDSSELVQMVFDSIQQSMNHHQKISIINSENGKKKKGSTKNNVQSSEPITQTDDQIKYAEFVKMSEEEHQKLVHDFGGKAVKEMIEAFNNRVGEKPNSKERRNRKSYFTIRNRLNRDAKKIKFTETTKQREQRIEKQKRDFKFEEQETRENGMHRMSQVFTS